MSQTGNVISRLPLPGAGLAGLKSTESKYLVINFDDPDVDAKGTANFKFNDKELLLTFIDALGTRAKLKQRPGLLSAKKIRLLSRDQFKSPNRCCRIAVITIAAVSARKMRPQV